MELPLTKAQRNAVFREFVALKIDPRGLECIIEKDSLDRPVSVLNHPNSGFYFKFVPYDCKWTPTSKGRAGASKSHSDNWGIQLDCVRQWLTALKPELEEPDFWEASSQEHLASRAATSMETANLQFTVQEQKFISDQLASIQAAVTEAHKLTKEQTEALAAGFKYLAESSGRLGRKDWINVAIGTVINIAVGTALAREAGRELLHLLTSSLQGLLFTAAKLLG